MFAKTKLSPRMAIFSPLAAPELPARETMVQASISSSSGILGFIC